MAEEHLSMPSKQTSPRSFDLNFSAVLLAERLVGEIFGWDLVDWGAVEPHKGRKFFFGRQRQSDPSIHDQLKPLFDRCDPSRNDFSALKPSPVVNDCLTRLVGSLCRHAGTHGLPVDTTDGSSLERTAEQDKLHLATIDHLLGRIDGHPTLRDRAGRIKSMASAAESELEKHFTDLINGRLESSFIPGGTLDRYKIKSLRDQASSRVEESQALNERELFGLARPALALDEEALIRIEMARILLSRFPYVRNYELMLLAELAMLQRPMTPRFSRERRLSSKAGAIDMALIERWDNAVAGMSSRVGPLPDLLSASDRTIAICGSGPLPMSALFFHLFTGASIILIDDDRAAVERSKRLIANLEQLEILEIGALTVRQQDAGRLVYHAPERAVEASHMASVVCDAVMIASLVSADAKTSIAEQFSIDDKAPELLIMRSATGLSARLAYDPVPTEALSQGRLAYCGETLPATQVATHLDRVEATRRNVACTASPDILAIAHPDVVNTTEIYCKLSRLHEGVDLDFGSCENIEDWIRKLEILGAKLGSAV